MAFHENLHFAAFHPDDHRHGRGHAGQLHHRGTPARRLPHHAARATGPTRTSTPRSSTRPWRCTGRATALANNWFIRFGKWAWSLMKGDMGYSNEQHNRPASELMGERLSLTIWISIATLIFMFIVAVPIGMLSAIRQVFGLGPLFHLPRANWGSLCPVSLQRSSFCCYRSAIARGDHGCRSVLA